MCQSCNSFWNKKELAILSSCQPLSYIGRLFFHLRRSSVSSVQSTLLAQLVEFPQTNTQ